MARALPPKTYLLACRRVAANDYSPAFQGRVR